MVKFAWLTGCIYGFKMSGVSCACGRILIQQIRMVMSFKRKVKKIRKTSKVSAFGKLQHDLLISFIFVRLFKDKKN